MRGKRENIIKKVVAFFILLMVSVFFEGTALVPVFAMDFTQDYEGNLLAEDENKFFYMIPADKVSSGECMLYVYGGSKANIELPKKCDTYTVTTISKDLTSMIPYLGYDMKSLETVKIPSGYKVIESGDEGKSGAFQNQNRLYRVEIPKSVKTIGANAFDGCDKSRLTFVSKKGTYARLYAIENGIHYTDSKKLGVDVFGTTMVVGEKKQIAIYNSLKKATFKTSDAKVVSVNSDGELVANKAGKAKITVKVAGKSYVYDFTVKSCTKTNVLNVIWANYVTKDMTADEKVAATKHWLDTHVKISGSKKTSKAALVKGKASKAGYDKAFIEILEHYGL